ncbi:AraC family transcriptional regulator [Aliikangiella marina]|uniref:AraC family transcriptional regulator n=1 Tax=Aliikangiella marina TaxID=1712262 RepID=A0A545T1H8_9GAMM|nr:AraC family transcriptional regulator [Aliikangiella marina]TQV71039.1 AraC family transcriptional regulator [Aliikangiella marina]
MKTHHHTIAIHFVHTILRSAEKLGLNTNQLLETANIDAKLIDKPDIRITPIQFSRLMQTMWIYADDEFLGMAKTPVRYGVFTLMAKQAVHYQKLRSVYRHLTNFYNLVNDALDLKFTVDGDQAEFTMKLHTPHRDKDNALREFLLLLFHRFPSWLIGQRIPLKGILFDYSKPRHFSEYRLMYPCRAEFDHAQCGFSFARPWLDAEVVRTPRELRDYMRRAPLDWFLRQEYHAVYTQRVALLLEQADSPADISMEQVAEKLHLTSRTLRRKLVTEGASFQKIKDHIRRDLAINLLSNRKTSVSQISQQLGFSEPAAFSRAFKLWTGLSPKEYRG